MPKPNIKKIGVLNLAFLSVTAIFTIRILPVTAIYGYGSIFYFLLLAALFFVPSALSCAELATGWPKTGGHYIWIREAFGPKLGFIGIWLEWSNTVVTFPATFAFIASTFAYVFFPELSQNKIFLFSAMVIMMWVTTYINYFGIHFSTLISNIGLFLGTILPELFLIVLSIIWLTQPGSHINPPSSFHEYIPQFHAKEMPFIVAIILSYSGMQISAFHAQEVENPQRNYPRAIYLAMFMILLLSIIGTLAIVMVIPPQSLSLIDGLMQASEIFLDHFHLKCLLPWMAFSLAIGTYAMINMWIIGPAKGLYATTLHGHLPKWFHYKNKHGAPTHILFFQGIVGTLCSGVYLFIPSVNGSYWLLLQVSGMLTLLMCILIFASVIRLRQIQPNTPRSYRIPFGKFGLMAVPGVGIVTCVVSFFLGFIPPSHIAIGNLYTYEFTLSFGIMGAIIMGLILQMQRTQLEL